MKPSIALELHRAAVPRIVAAHRACNARAFGSVAHDDDTSDSDLDLLIDPTSDTTLMDVAAIQVELESLLGVVVDVLTPMALPDNSETPYWRRRYRYDYGRCDATADWPARTTGVGPGGSDPGTLTNLLETDR